MRKRKVSDRDLLDWMERDPQAGMEAVVEQYTGLLWRVSEKYLQDPEDIKECINDTFLEFYIHRDRFDSEKGSLTAYLVQITRNLSISRYRKNTVRHDLPPAPSEETFSQEQAEAQIDLERAMASLKPEDAEIIRMKYYGGMSVREIAASLNLPYDTVKKRHQRSLSKLRMLILGILVLVLLAILVACAYSLLRYFGIVPGYGISEDPQALIFTLEEPVQAEDGSGTYTIYDAMVLNGKIYISMRYQPATPELSAELMNDDPAYEKFLNELHQATITLNGEPVRALIGISNGSYLSGSLVRGKEFWEITWDIRLSDPSEIPRWEEGIEAALNPFGLDLTCRLVQVKADQVSDHSYQVGSRGGLLAIPRLEERRLIVGVYPLSTGTETVLTNLLRGLVMEGKAGDLTVTAPGGEELVGELLVGANNDYFYDWDFGPAQPGKYTLHIPYVFLSVPVEEPISFRLDLTQGTWEEQALPAPGGTLSIESCQPVEVPIGETIPGAGGPFTMEEGCRVWTLRLRYHPMEDLVLTSCIPHPGEEMEIEEKIRYDVAVDGEGNYIPFRTDGFTCSPLSPGAQDNVIDLSVWGWDGCYDPSNVVLTVSGPLSMRWEHSFDLPLVVEAG